MEQIKRRWHNLPLRKALILYIAIAALLALLLCAVTENLCDFGVQRVYSSYSTSMKKYYLTNEQGEQLGEGAYIGKDIVLLSSKDQWLVDFLQALPSVTTPLYSALCILAAAMLFYEDKLKRPMAKLRLASEKISNNDVDFTITSESSDELGQLCTSFETMRAALSQNFSEMWRQMEERRQLNAAFAHDLRTPLTVLKGYNEMLQAGEDEQIQAIAVTMERHISRLEHYVHTMSQLHRLEDTQPSFQPVLLKDLIDSLGESGEMVCQQAKKQFSLEDRTVSLELFLDGNGIAQVCSNLIANAARYAAGSVKLCLEERREGLALWVEDDGPGFDQIAIEKAADPYFTGEKEEHLGLGLFIGKMLCEHHGGWLEIENSPLGAKVTAFFKVDKK